MHVPCLLSRIMVSGLLVEMDLFVCTCWFQSMVTLFSWHGSGDFCTWSHHCSLSNFTPISLHMLKCSSAHALPCLCMYCFLPILGKLIWCVALSHQIVYRVCICYLWVSIIFLNLIYSHPLVIRMRFSGKSRSEREIKTIHPSTLWMMSAVLSSVIFSSVADRWPGSKWWFISNPLVIVPNGPVTTGKIYVITFHILLISISMSLYWLSLSVPCVLTYESSGMAI